MVAVAALLIAGVAAATSAEIATAAGITFSGTPFGTADWDGDGHADVIARNDATAGRGGRSRPTNGAGSVLGGPTATRRSWLWHGQAAWP